MSDYCCSYNAAQFTTLNTESCERRREKTGLFAYAKTKAQISFAVTAKLISAFVFAKRIVQSLYFLNPKFQASSHLLWLYSPVCVGPGRKPRRPVFSQRGSCYQKTCLLLDDPNRRLLSYNMSCIMRKHTFCICKNKGADQLHGNYAADQVLYFRYIVQSLSFPNPKFQASSHLLLPWSDTPEDRFSCDATHIKTYDANDH